MADSGIKILPINFFGESKYTSVMIRLMFILLFISTVEAQNLDAIRWNTNDSLQVQKTFSGPNVYPSRLWISSQFIPSPQLISVQDEGLKFGLRWQVTPVLYSFGINRKLSPWRFLVAEPLVRQNGSIELFLTPEWLNLTEKFKTNWLFRTGIRAYFPLYRRGEYLSGSVATSYYNYNGEQGISYEAGIYLFFGILGFQATYSPDMKTSPWIFTLRLRYF
jgi:hypothetical protein